MSSTMMISVASTRDCMNAIMRPTSSNGSSTAFSSGVCLSSRIVGAAGRGANPALLPAAVVILVAIACLMPAAPVHATTMAQIGQQGCGGDAAMLPVGYVALVAAFFFLIGALTMGCRR